MLALDNCLKAAPCQGRLVIPWPGGQPRRPEGMNCDGGILEALPVNLPLPSPAATAPLPPQGVNRDQRVAEAEAIGLQKSMKRNGFSYCAQSL